MSWEKVYELWRRGSYYFPESLSGPLNAEPVFVKYAHSGRYIYGYDWLQKEIGEQRKELIAKDPAQFLGSPLSTNKGTIQTAQMLIEAKDEEERVAIWIAATAAELMDTGLEISTSRYLWRLRDAALLFLKERYILWHHAMKKLVPEIMIPYSVLGSVQCDREETAMGLIQMSVLMLKATYMLLRYSSISEEEIEREKVAERKSLRLDE